VGKSGGKISLGRARHRCVDNYKTRLREIKWGGMDLIDPTQDRE
jgi:hypothetical protein